MTSGRLWEVKNRRKFQTASYESGDTVIYKRWSLSRGSSYINLTCCLGEVVARAGLIVLMPAEAMLVSE